MTSTASPSHVVTGIAPWLPVTDASKAVDFYQAAFGAVVSYRLEDAGSLAVAQLSIDGADFWVQQDEDRGAQAPAGSSGLRMILSVEQPDPLFGQAVAAGATEVVPMEDQHGWRTGRLVDPFGYDWEIARPVAI